MADPTNYQNRQWTGGWNDPPPTVLADSDKYKDRKSIVSKQLRPGTRNYPSNPVVNGAGVPGQQFTSPMSPGGYNNPQGGSGGYNTQTPGGYNNPSADYNTGGYNSQSAGYGAGQGGEAQHQRTDANAGSWSLTDYLRAGIDKFDMDAINQTISTWTEKLGSYSYSMPQNQHNVTQSQDHLFSAHANQYNSYNNQYNNQHNTNDQYNTTDQYNTNSQYDNSNQYAQHAQHTYNQQMYNQQKYDYDQYALFRGPEDPSPPPTNELGHPIAKPATEPNIPTSVAAPAEQSFYPPQQEQAQTSPQTTQPVELPVPALEQNEQYCQYYNYSTQQHQQPEYLTNLGAVPNIPTAQPTVIQEEGGQYHSWQPHQVNTQPGQSTEYVVQHVPSEALVQPFQQHDQVYHEQAYHEPVYHEPVSQEQQVLYQEESFQQAPPQEQITQASQPEQQVFDQQDPQQGKPAMSGPEEQVGAQEESPQPQPVTPGQDVEMKQEEFEEKEPAPLPETSAAESAVTTGPADFFNTIPTQSNTQAEPEDTPRVEPEVALPYDPESRGVEDQVAPAPGPRGTEITAPPVPSAFGPPPTTSASSLFDSFGPPPTAKSTPPTSPFTGPHTSAFRPPPVLSGPPTNMFATISSAPPMSESGPAAGNPFRSSPGTRSSPGARSSPGLRSSPGIPTSFLPPSLPTTAAAEPTAELPNSPPTLPVESFGGVSIFKPVAVEEEPSEPLSSGWDNDFDTWNDDKTDNFNKDFEDIQL